MTFFVEKKLALGTIRFGVSLPRTPESVDGKRELSTGPGGEFIGRRGEGFFFGGNDRVDALALPTAKSIRSTPFWTSLKEVPKLFAAGAAGVLLFLLGIGVVARKGPQGWIEVILGSGMIAVPIVMTTQRRKQIQEQEERERAEREATEARNRQMLTAYTAALDRAQQRRDEDAFQQLERERQALTLPYDLWGWAARRAVVLVGFDDLARRGVEGSSEVARLMDRLSRAAGVTSEDEKQVKQDLYRTIVWHLLANDRIGLVQEQQLATLRRGLDVVDEPKAIDQFRRLGGLTGQKLPRQQCNTQLAFQEYCIHQTASSDGMLHVTNKRLLLDAKKRREFALPAISDVTVMVDESRVSVRTDNPKKPLRLRVDDPIYTAAMIDLASAIDERPRGFA